MKNTAAVIVRPPTYWLPIVNRWYWCKLTEMHAAVPAVAELAGNTYNPTLEELIRHFVALTRINKHPQEDSTMKPKKIFRYSLGDGFWGIEVPYLERGINEPPWEFDLSTLKQTSPLTEIFVSAGWAYDTLRAIHAGAIAAAHWTDNELIGYPMNDDRHKPIIRLGKIQRTSEI